MSLPYLTVQYHGAALPGKGIKICAMSAAGSLGWLKRPRDLNGSICRRNQEG
ncbi:MAG: hypothetical protein MI863_20430 [Desulfobacterales bacterium]|nr:hypothetical protein [Desulfobacterales bacterium]